MDALGVGPDEAIALFALASSPAPDETYYLETVRGVHAHRDEVDVLIRRAAENWRLERMPLVDRNILRLGAYEICRSPDVPYAVAINEAVDLGKRFGSEDSGSFINGILDRISEIRMKKTGKAHRAGAGRSTEEEGA
ncbi:MAG: transcription antitermination factor NusB [Deltaproteobacteria bacterium]|nr:transcription antitermination factor NusB [Deltaproteobacteria bacterium]